MEVYFDRSDIETIDLQDKWYVGDFYKVDDQWWWRKTKMTPAQVEARDCVIEGDKAFHKPAVTVNFKSSRPLTTHFNTMEEARLFCDNLAADAFTKPGVIKL